jgi:hypothetical protein
MIDKKYTDIILTYKYSVLICKNLRENDKSLDLFESVVLEYRENLSSIYNDVFIDIILTNDNIKIQESDSIDTYGLLAIEHYLKFIEVNKHPSENFKICGKKLLRRIKCIMDTNYELPSWVYQ